MRNTLATALYCRSASLNYEAVKHQESILRNYTIKHCYENICVYIDSGFDGVNCSRPAFTQMKTDVEAGKIGVVLVKDFSRITRNTFEIPELITMFIENGVELISAIDGFSGKSFLEAHDSLLRLYGDHLSKQRKKAET